MPQRLIVGVQPVREALRAGQPLDRVLIAKGGAAGRVQEIIELCRSRAIALRFEPKRAIERLAPGTTHQGVVAIPLTQPYADPAKAFANASCVVILDGVEDPQNLGAIVRTALCAGADAVVIPERRAAGLNETVIKASAGAALRLPVVRVGNIRRQIEELKQRGFWIYGLDAGGQHEYDQIDYALPTAFVLGAEGKGLHEHVRRQCDFLVRIPLQGPVASLNVSVAAGVVLFEWRRRLRHKG